MISLIHPSRGRAGKSISNAKDWINRAGAEVQLIVSIDESDPQKSLYEEYYQDFMAYRSMDSFLINPNTCVVEATNIAAKASIGDVLIYLSDDFKCFDNWGAAINDLMPHNEPALLKAHDQLQKFDAEVLTIPIMNRKMYEALGYFWHPGYRSMWVDVDLFHVAKNMGALRLCPELEFEHQHYSVGKAPKDKTYQESDRNWKQGIEFYNLRKSQGFK